MEYLHPHRRPLSILNVHYKVATVQSSGSPIKMGGWDSQVAWTFFLSFQIQINVTMLIIYKYIKRAFFIQICEVMELHMYVIFYKLKKNFLD